MPVPESSQPCEMSPVTEVAAIEVPVQVAVKVAATHVAKLVPAFMLTAGIWQTPIETMPSPPGICALASRIGGEITASMTASESEAARMIPMPVAPLRNVFLLIVSLLTHLSWHKAPDRCRVPTDGPYHRLAVEVRRADHRFVRHVDPLPLGIRACRPLYDQNRVSVHVLFERQPHPVVPILGLPVRVL